MYYISPSLKVDILFYTKLFVFCFFWCSIILIFCTFQRYTDFYFSFDFDTVFSFKLILMRAFWIMEHILSIFYSLLDKFDFRNWKSYRPEILTEFFFIKFECGVCKMFFLMSYLFVDQDKRENVTHLGGKRLKGTNYMLCKHLGHIITLWCKVLLSLLQNSL